MIRNAARCSIVVAGMLSVELWAGPRALPEGQLPADSRLTELKSVDGYHPFTEVDKSGWPARKAEVIRQMLVAEGLWPLPTRTPLNAVVHSRITRDAYTVDKVYFQSHPGHFVTGSLYRPLGRTGKAPIVLCPYGHFKDGRYYDLGPEGARREIANGAERFENSGRYPLQSICVQLARMGCVAFQYDMEGYADSIQFEHRPGVRPAMNTPENYGMFSPQAELRQIHMMGLQTWNSIRALDFVAALPDVDVTRIGVTGASGGGTQSMILAAIDQRITAAAPAVMVSTSMQGGCTCENATLLRVDGGNIDFAALFAPKPYHMTAADDWTRELAAKGLPELQKHWAMLGARGNVTAALLTHFKHNYNAVSRVSIYNHFNKAFKLGYSEPVIERDYQPLDRDETCVWDDKKHPRPSGDQVGDAHERKLVAHIAADQRKAIDALSPKDDASLKEYRRVIGGAWEAIIGRNLQTVGPIEYKLADKQERDDCVMMTATLTLSRHSEQMPCLFLHPKSGWNGQVVLWLGDEGKNVLLEGGRPAAAASDLLKRGFSVASADLFMQGEFTADGKTPEKTKLTPYGKGGNAWSVAACYHYGYNRSLFAQRVADALTLIRFVQTDKHAPKAIHLVGLGPTAGPIAAAARAFAGDAVDKAAIHTAGFRFASLDALDHPMFVPGAVKYNDTAGLLSLNAPHELLLSGEDAPLIDQAYKAAGGKLTRAGGKLTTQQVADWIK